ncbi:MAG: hypothetical protein Q7W05_09760 [Deltaproteobacteria bacterium]|nr:hypothetical protein [Deltaproteobacteria bacterium]
MGNTPGQKEIACQQVMLDDGSVYLLQWSIFPAATKGEFSPEKLMDRYLQYIRNWVLFGSSSGREVIRR